MKNKNQFLWILAGAGIFLFAVTITWWVEVSAFAAALLKIGMAVGIFWAVDRVLLREIDTINELKNGNVAYAIFLFSISVLIATAVSTA